MKLISSLFQYFGNKLLSISEVFHPSSKKGDEQLSEHEQQVLAWIKDKGDKSLRLEYNLDLNSTVVDLGGYEGQWASDIFAKYQSRVFVFEPVQRFSEMIQKRFERNSNIVVHQFGLGSQAGTLELNLDNDASSIYKTGNQVEIAHVVAATPFLLSLGIHKIDLIKINIEGGEYELLEHFIQTDYIKSILNIQVQFHSFVPDAERRMHIIQETLKKTHHLTYQYPFVWENWERNAV